jgi:hypothetical protein
MMASPVHCTVQGLCNLEDWDTFRGNKGLGYNTCNNKAS